MAIGEDWWEPSQQTMPSLKSVSWACLFVCFWCVCAYIA